MPTSSLVRSESDAQAQPVFHSSPLDHITSSQNPPSTSSNNYRSIRNGEPRDQGNEKQYPENNKARLWTASLHRLLQSQENVAILRSQVQEHRMALRNARQEVSNYDRLFMDEVYTWWANRREGSYDRLASLYGKCQDVRRKVGPIEDDYEQLELQLGEFEFTDRKHLSRIMAALENKAPDNDFGTIRSSISDSHISYETSSSRDLGDRTSLTRPSPSDAKAHHGTRLLTASALQDHEALLSSAPSRPLQSKSESEKLRTRYSFQKERARLNSPSLRQVEHGFATNWTPIPPEYDTIQNVDKSNFLANIEPELDYQASLGSEDSLMDARAETDPNLERLLLFDDDFRSRSKLSDYLLTFKGSHSRINQWLLHRLRTSYTEAVSLKETVSAEGVTDAAWSEKALALWDDDEAARPPMYESTIEPAPESHTFDHGQVNSLQPQDPSESLQHLRDSSGPDLQDRKRYPPVSSNDQPLFVWKALL
ncbi:MAG: hypothetical protein M1820_008056 [Bogoriella megaspora]|nr:MAG: hypothetical protein M1820_008056 [Bogoriella megaspora]